MAEWNNINARKPSDHVRQSGNEAAERNNNEFKAKVNEGIKTKNLESTSRRDLAKGEQPVKAGKEVPQSQSKDFSSIRNQAATQNKEFADAKESAHKLNNIGSQRPTTASGKETATKEGVTGKNTDGAEVAKDNAPKTQPNAGDTANMVNRQVAHDKAAGVVRELAGKARGEVAKDGKKVAEGDAKPKAETNPKTTETTQKADATNASQLAQIGQAGVATAQRSDKADKKSEDAGSEKKAESKKRGESSRSRGPFSTDGSEEKKTKGELGALMSGFGSSPEEGAGEAGLGIEAAPRTEPLPETAEGLAVFSDATDAEVKFISDARLYFNSVEKQRYVKLEQIAELDRKMGALLDMGLTALGERLITNDAEHQRLLTRGLQLPKNSYGGLRG